MFKVGDKAVYPAQGVGVIEAVEAREISGQTKDFYILRIYDNDMTIMIPVENADTLGMRALMGEQQVRHVLDHLQDKAEHSEQQLPSWSRRQRLYQEKLRSGSPLAVAEVLRELYQLKMDKDLSYGEKKMLELAQRLLVKELALAQDQDENQVCQRLEHLMAS